MEINELKEKVGCLINSLGYDLIECNMKTVHGNKTLNIVIDSVDNIDLKAISLATEKVNELLDVLDPFPYPYVLDVSSLGVEKPLDISKLDLYINRFVHVHLINPIEGNNIYEGTLLEVNNDSIKISFMIKTRNKIVDIQKLNISKIRLAIKF